MIQLNPLLIRLKRKQVINISIVLSLLSCVFFSFTDRNYSTQSVASKIQIGNLNKNVSNIDSSFLGNKGTFIDVRDGKEYQWQRIGTQIWMVQNLAFKTDSGCYAFRHRWKKAKRTGYMYTWEAAQKAAPKGWHVPSIDEYIAMLKTLCNDSNNDYNFYYCIKENPGGLNFNQIHGAYFSKQKSYCKGIIGFQYSGYWTSYCEKNIGRNKNIDQYGVFEFSHFWDYAGITYEAGDSKEDGYVVRCIKDDNW